MTNGQPIVVGVDGSEHSAAALAWAVEEARHRELPLHVVHAWIWPLMHVPLGPAPGAPEGAGFQAQAEQILADAVAEAGRLGADLTITSALEPGSPGPVLNALSRSAALVVVGSRGIGGFTGMLVGSSASSLARDAACPVVVVRGTVDPTLPVLVGVDDPAADDPTLQLAFDAARMRGVPLVVARAIEAPLALYGLAGGLTELLDVERKGAHDFLADLLAPARDRNPDVEVRIQVLVGSPGGALSKASADAQLVVVGSRGMGGFKRAMLGSTSSSLLHHAECPVLIDPSRHQHHD